MSTLDLPVEDLTVDDLEQLPDDFRYELHEGDLVVMSPAVMWHSRIGRRLTNYFDRDGRPAYQEAGIKFGRRSSRTADVAVFVSEIDEDRAFFSPETVAIAVEIVSPSSEDDDRIDKPHRYAKAGIPEYWRVERSTDGNDAVIFRYKLARTADGKATYAENGVTTLSALEG